MKPAALLLTAAALLSFALPAAAQDWRAVDGLDDIEAKFWVDMDSIRVEAGITHFRTRILIPTFAGFAYADSVADCKAKTVEMRKVDLVQDGKVVKTQTFEPGTQQQSLEDEEGLILQPLICKP